MSESIIQFILSSEKPWDTTYQTQEGQVIYKVVSESPTMGFMSGRRDIKISKIMPSAGRSRDSFAHLATVEYHMISSSRITMGGLDVSTDDYFRKEGWHFETYARDHIFTGPGGREYFWRLGPNNCELFVNDTAKTPVARFHRRRWQWGISNSPPNSLEIYATGIDMVDQIVVTGVYVEKLRREKEKSSSSAGRRNAANAANAGVAAVRAGA